MAETNFFALSCNYPVILDYYCKYSITIVLMSILIKQVSIKIIGIIVP